MNPQQPAKPAPRETQPKHSVRFDIRRALFSKSDALFFSRSSVMRALLGLLGVMMAMVASRAAQTDGVPLLDKEAFIEQIGSEIDGRVLDIALDAEASPPVYRVKILSDSGIVRVLSFDAESGQRSEP